MSTGGSFRLVSPGNGSRPLFLEHCVDLREVHLLPLSAFLHGCSQSEKVSESMAELALVVVVRRDRPSSSTAAGPGQRSEEIVSGVPQTSGLRESRPHGFLPPLVQIARSPSLGCPQVEGFVLEASKQPEQLVQRLCLNWVPQHHEPLSVVELLEHPAAHDGVRTLSLRLLDLLEDVFEGCPRLC